MANGIMDASRSRTKATTQQQLANIDSTWAEVDETTGNPNFINTILEEIISTKKVPQKVDDYSDLDVEYGEDAVASRPPEYTPSPRLKGDSGTLSFEESATKLQRESGDSEFKDSVQRLADKYDITTREVYDIIQGESKWKPDSENSLGYKGLFQFGEDAITDINRFTDATVDYNTIQNLPPSEQVAVYDKHLERWGYDGSIPLAVMQAAPGKAKSLKGKPDSTIVYPVDTDPDSAWSRNPGWRKGKNGPITLGSLKNYYR